MFFTLSKILGFFALPSNLLISIGIRRPYSAVHALYAAGQLADRDEPGAARHRRAVAARQCADHCRWRSGFRRGTPRAARRTALSCWAARFRRDVSAARGEVALDEAAERITATAELARRYPNARIIFSGGSGSLIYDEGPEAPFAVRQLRGSRRRPRPHYRRGAIPQHARKCGLFAVARQSRSRASAGCSSPPPITCHARSLPFGRLAFAVDAYPVDWRTRGPADLVRPFSSLAEGLRRTDTAVREWVGLLVYWLTGKSTTLFPAP